MLVSVIQVSTQMTFLETRPGSPRIATIVSEEALRILKQKKLPKTVKRKFKARVQMIEAQRFFL